MHRSEDATPELLSIAVHCCSKLAALPSVYEGAKGVIPSSAQADVEMILAVDGSRDDIGKFLQPFVSAREEARRPSFSRSLGSGKPETESCPTREAGIEYFFSLWPARNAFQLRLAEEFGNCGFCIRGLS
jgi:hypothetical protein